jgi:hypothetical protein
MRNKVLYRIKEEEKILNSIKSSPTGSATFCVGNLLPEHVVAGKAIGEIRGREDEGDVSSY